MEISGKKVVIPMAVVASVFATLAYFIIDHWLASLDRRLERIEDRIFPFDQPRIPKGESK